MRLNDAPKIFKKTIAIKLVLLGGAFLLLICSDQKTYIYDNYGECYDDWGSDCKEITQTISNNYVGSFFHTESNFCGNDTRFHSSSNRRVVRGGIGATDTRVHS